MTRNIQRTSSRHQVHTGPPTSAQEFAQWWWDRTYNTPERGASISMGKRCHALLTLHINPWLVRHEINTIHDIDAFHVDALVDELAGIGTKRTTNQPASIGAAKWYSMKEAAALGGSLSMVKRFNAEGKFPGAQRHETPAGLRVLIPAGDLIANGWDLQTGRPVSDRRRPAAISERSANEVLRLLRRILNQAIRYGLITNNPASGVEAVPPLNSRLRTPPDETRERVVSLSEAKRIASRLSLPHQLVLWLGRVLGLRISELYGLTAGDFIEHDGLNLVVIRRQGGRNFSVYDDDNVVYQSRNAPIKSSDNGWRTLVVPDALNDFMAVYIDAFHRLDDRSVPTDTPLVVGIREVDHP